MGTWREARSFAAVMLAVGIVSVTTIVSCGGDGESSGSNGGLCEQCGDTDGPCNADGAVLTDEDDKPEGCPATGECRVQLQCVRKVDSGQRRCFPLNPTTSSLDFRYECDGSRPALVPTATPVPTTTVTPTVTATPADTGPTATGPTPSATGPTPEATATPAEGEDVSVDILVKVDEDEDNDLPSSFSVTVTYPTAKGSFLVDGVVDCGSLDDGVTVQDTGAGTLTITFAGDSDGLTSINPSCLFRQVTGQTLTDADLGSSSNPSALIVEIEVLS